MKHLAKLVDIDQVSLNLEATHETTGEKIKDVFCKDWELSKKGLINVTMMVHNPIVKILISVLIVLGDSIQKKICDNDIPDDGVR